MLHRSSIATALRDGRSSILRLSGRSTDGCIRLEQPLDLAVFLLRDQPQWTRAAIEQAIENGSERSIPLTADVPVYVLYWTARVGDDGHMEFHRDHYDRDAALSDAINAR